MRGTSSSSSSGPVVRGVMPGGCGGGAAAAGYRAGVAQQPYTKWEAHRHDEIEVDYKQLDDSGRPPPLPGSGCFMGRKGTVLKVKFCNLLNTE